MFLNGVLEEEVVASLQLLNMKHVCPKGFVRWVGNRSAPPAGLQAKQLHAGSAGGSQRVGNVVTGWGCRWREGCLGPLAGTGTPVMSHSSGVTEDALDTLFWHTGGENGGSVPPQ